MITSITERSAATKLLSNQTWNSPHLWNTEGIYSHFSEQYILFPCCFWRGFITSSPHIMHSVFFIVQLQ